MLKTITKNVIIVLFRAIPLSKYVRFFIG